MLIPACPGKNRREIGKDVERSGVAGRPGERQGA